MGKTIRVIAVSEPIALLVSKHLEEPHVVISIREPNNEPVEFEKNASRLAVLPMYFYDLDHSQSRWNEEEMGRIEKKYGHGIFRPEQANVIIDFVEEWKDKVVVIVVHCAAGVSRSAGVAAAILKVLTGSDKYIFSNRAYIPNRYVYNTILTEWQKRR
jgi:predicted protein tyrosine phosphatase